MSSDINPRTSDGKLSATPHSLPLLRVAIIHYWFVSDRGGEKVVESILRLLPQADVYTHVIDRGKFPRLDASRNISETFIARVPGARRHYQKLLPLMPVALEQLDLSAYDLVISSESGPAKGVITGPDTLHVCYCHSPMRYLWDMYHDYRRSAGFATRWIMPLLTHYLRIWDQNSAARVDHFIANSQFIRRRIRKAYGRDASVIHPPVAIDAFEFRPEKADHFLMLGQLTGYKRPDIAVDAFAAMPDRELVIIGEGEMLEAIRRRNLPNVKCLGHQPFDVLKRYLETARALVFPGVEDFGIVPVEALACGTPVIAFARGGALETVEDRVTGLLFHTQTAEALAVAVQAFDEWEPSMERSLLRQSAERFGEVRFRNEMLRFIEEKWEAFQAEE